jgi:hypothetical protein
MEVTVSLWRTGSSKVQGLQKDKTSSSSLGSGALVWLWCGVAHVKFDPCACRIAGSIGAAADGRRFFIIAFRSPPQLLCRS